MSSFIRLHRHQVDFFCLFVSFLLYSLLSLLLLLPFAFDR